MVSPTLHSAPLNRLLREQATLLAGFSHARDVGITTDEGVGHLREIRARLQDHLASVDRHVYPLLRRLAGRDARVAHALGKVETSEVAAQVQEFFDTQLDPQSSTFFGAWGALYVAVQRRFRLERTLLFPVLAASPAGQSLALPSPATRLTTGPVVITETTKRKWRNTP